MKPSEHRDALWTWAKSIITDYLQTSEFRLTDIMIWENEVAIVYDRGPHRYGEQIKIKLKDMDNSIDDILCSKRADDKKRRDAISKEAAYLQKIKESAEKKQLKELLKKYPNTK